MKKLSIILIVLLALMVVTGSALARERGTRRTATLSGANEIGGGDLDGSGFARISIFPGQGMVCWEVSYEGIDTPTAAHIHSAPAGVNGPIVVPLSPIESGCGTVDRLLIKELVRNPRNYYVNVHNAAFPGGAIRGQLHRPGQN